MKKSFQLLFFGFKARTNIIICSIFLVIGLLMELAVSLEMAGTQDVMMWQPVGSVFLACIPLFGTQMLCSLTASAFVNTSPASRGLKTSRSLLVTAIFIGAIFVVQVLMKAVIYLIYPKAGPVIWQELVFYAAVNALLLVCTAFLFRFFVATFLAIYAVMFAFGSFSGYNAAMTGEKLSIVHYLPQFQRPLPYILLSALIIAAGLAVYYGLSLLLYKVPFSKMAFGAGLKSR
ncbi:MAG: hypothetical protein LUE29_12105 [Lachnospiraceae bacterium]|nr:hypothetical protein [Lachnospiraceae bacterium]